MFFSAFIARMIRRWRFFPLVDGGRGLRQPVHADDLAGACLSALRNAATFGREYNLSGGQTLSYRAMVQEVFAGLGRTPRFVPVPGWLLKRLVSSLRILPRYRSLSPDMVDRMSMDLCFGHEQARRDFGYAPRPFRLDATALAQNDNGIDPAGPA